MSLPHATVTLAPLPDCACGYAPENLAYSGGWNGRWSVRCSGSKCVAAAHGVTAEQARARWTALTRAQATSPPQPLLTLEGVATTRLFEDSGEELSWVGTPDQWVSSSIDKVFGPKLCALRLLTGQRYRCDVFEAPALSEIPVAHLPSDILTQEGPRIEFYAKAYPTPRLKWAADRRVSLKNAVGIWTDGLMVTTTDETLKPGAVYRVLVAHNA